MTVLREDQLYISSEEEPGLPAIRTAVCVALHAHSRLLAKGACGTSLWALQLVILWNENPASTKIRT
jgi:hypothetical protein